MNLKIYEPMARGSQIASDHRIWVRYKTVEHLELKLDPETSLANP